MRAIILHNPGAGSGEIAPEDLRAALACGGIAGRYCSTDSPDFPDALQEPADLIVIAGGDGTVVKAIDHLHGRNTPIAILPLGSANNIARSLGIKADPIGSRAQAGNRPRSVGSMSAPPVDRGESVCSSRR